MADRGEKKMQATTDRGCYSTDAITLVGRGKDPNISGKHTRYHFGIRSCAA